MYRRQVPAFASGGRLLRTSRNRFDVIIVGSGIAGLLLACELDSRGLKTLLLCKGALFESNTSHAQGGLAAVTGDNPFDSPDQHLSDTLASGAGLTVPEVACLMVQDGARLVARLEELGVSFDRTGRRRDLAREGGHGQSRVLHSKDSSGKAITTALIELALESKRLTVREHCFVSGLIISEGTCVGVRLLHDNSNISELFCGSVVLATGGLGCAFERTTNPSTATGDGIAMAYRAGARLADMEFVQFHPTSLAVPGKSTFLISEAVRGAGAILLDRNNERFAFKYCKDGELGTRDVVAQAIFSTMQKESSPSVKLDLRPIGLENIEKKFPAIVAACRVRGVDPTSEPIPVAPAAHYFMGGIATDCNGCTNIRGLFAIGECASTGLHGANRLASNSLLEGGVMALRLADYIAGSSFIARTSFPSRRQPIDACDLATTSNCTADLIDEYRHKLSSAAGLVRDAEILRKFGEEHLRAAVIAAPPSRSDIEAANIGLLGNLIVRSALNRCESRGAHFRSDFPSTDDENYLKRYFVSRDTAVWLPVEQEIVSEVKVAAN